MRLGVYAFCIFVSTLAGVEAGFLEIHHIDVGQADSTLIIGPNGTTILVDAGNSGFEGYSDGGKVVYQYLESLNLQSLDYIVVTHRDSDHVGGFSFGDTATENISVILADTELGIIKSRSGRAGIDDDNDLFVDFVGYDECSTPAEIPDPEEIQWFGFDHYYPLAAYDNGEETCDDYCNTSRTFRRYVQTVEAMAIRQKVSHYYALMALYNNPIDLGDGATATFVCSNGFVAGDHVRVPGSCEPDSLSVNSRSIGLYIQYRHFDYLVAGDLTGNEGPQVEQSLGDLLVSIADTPLGDPLDVLRINHHGSNTSTELGFLTDVQPEIAIISCGNDNGYGHPKQEVVDRLFSIYNYPLACVYLTQEGTPRNWHGMCHQIIHGVSPAIIIYTDGMRYFVTNDLGGLDQYPTDDPNIVVPTLTGLGLFILLCLLSVKLKPGLCCGKFKSLGTCLF